VVGHSWSRHCQGEHLSKRSHITQHGVSRDPALVLPGPKLTHESPKTCQSRRVGVGSELRRRRRSRAWACLADSPRPGLAGIRVPSRTGLAAETCHQQVLTVVYGRQDGPAGVTRGNVLRDAFRRWFVESSRGVGQNLVACRMGLGRHGRSFRQAAGSDVQNSKLADLRRRHHRAVCPPILNSVRLSPISTRRSAQVSRPRRNRRPQVSRIRETYRSAQMRGPETLGQLTSHQ
jgi:hypothetical protein